MKKIFLFLAIGCVFIGCHSKLDLENVDTRTQVEAGVALPVGSFHITLKELVGVDGFYIDSLNNQGVLTYRLDTSISRFYHQVDLAKYLTSKHLELNVYQKLDEDSKAGKLPSGFYSDGRITTRNNPVAIWLDFPLEVKLKGINNPDSINHERLDSAIIDNAAFASTIICTGGLPLDWAWIDTVTLDLGDRINRAQGNTVTVYSKATGGHKRYGDSIPTLIDNFHLVMMKNRKPIYPSEYLLNTVNDLVFNVHFKFIIPAETTLTIPKDAGFDYKLDIRFIDYTAIWGMFDPSNDMYDEDTVDLSESWGKLDFLTKSKLPFYEPVVNAMIETQIAGALKLDSGYVFTTDADGIRKRAIFGDPGAETEWYFHRFKPGEYLPLSSEPGTVSIDKMKVQFNRSNDGGRINELFRNMPNEFGYKFTVKFDEGETPQIRITRNTSIKVHSNCIMPLIFDNGVFVHYKDTTHEVNLSEVSLDSLQNSSDIIDTIHSTNLKLILKAQNTIPLHVKAAMRCYDEKDSVLMSPDDPSKPFLLFKSDTIILEPCKFEMIGGKMVATDKPGETTIIASLEQKDVDVLSKVKMITYSVILDDQAIQYAYQKGLINIQLRKEQGVTLKIGLTANVNAVLNFDKNDKK